MASIMSCHAIREEDFPQFVDAVIAGQRTIGPIAKRGKFDYEELESADDLRLDFDVTLQPPKKAFFPPVQQLLAFEGEEVRSCIDPVPTVLFGVHFYDIKGIDMLDELMSSPRCDGDYLAQRRATTIVGSSIQAVSPWAFWDSVGADVQPKGMDAFLTKIANGYVYAAYTEAGRELLRYGAFSQTTPEQREEAEQADKALMGTCEHKLDGTTEQIARISRESYDNTDLWKELAEGCFSCGSCNLVCPTCFCFDVQDHWNLDQVSGDRTRYWDSCMACDFASTTLAGGGAENFRGERYERFRHRFMRKTCFLNDRVGGPCCTGCGRCASACTARIADPVKVINRVMEVAR